MSFGPAIAHVSGPRIVTRNFQLRVSVHSYVAQLAGAFERDLTEFDSMGESARSRGEATHNTRSPESASSAPNNGATADAPAGSSEPACAVGDGALGP